MKDDFRAIVFDLDGVIVHSEDLHARAKRMTLEKYGISYPETLFNDFKGRPDLVFWKFVAHHLANGKYTDIELDACKRTVFFSLADELTTVPGVIHFIAMARKRFRKMGLVSSATGPDLMVSDRKFGIRKWFDMVLLGEDSEQHKPHPEPYLKAIAHLGVQACETLVIEDSPNGVISAKAAGCYVIGITTGFTLEELKTAGADDVADTFEEIELLLQLEPPVTQ